MPSPLVLVANEPRAYRETIALALSALRPQAEVVAIEPVDLDTEVQRRHPDVAVCSQLSPTVEVSVPSWVLLYPEGVDWAVISVEGERSTSGGLDLDALAAVISPS